MKFLKIYSNKLLVSGISSGSGATLTDGTQSFLTSVKVGDVVWSTAGTESATILSIQSNASLTMSKTVGGALAYEIYSATQYENARMIIVDKIIGFKAENASNSIDIIYAPNSSTDNIRIFTTENTILSKTEMALNAFIEEAINSAKNKPENTIEVKFPVTTTAAGSFAVRSVAPST